MGVEGGAKVLIDEGERKQVPRAGLDDATQGCGIGSRGTGDHADLGEGVAQAAQRPA